MIMNKQTDRGNAISINHYSLVTNDLYLLSSKLVDFCELDHPTHHVQVCEDAIQDDSNTLFVHVCNTFPLLYNRNHHDLPYRCQTQTVEQ